ncbi:hypothetical protein OG749_40725 [Streptomyces nojiriensis]|uniref:hypothetical protein n=1 Tax=Streptomyces nojiriensis TaxID=66374 RepID=UPI002E18CF59
MGWVRGAAAGAAVVLVAAGAAGCTGGNGSGGSGPSAAADAAEAKPPVAAPPALVITQAEAEKVFNQFEWERRTPVQWKSADGLAKVATDPLLTGWRAATALAAAQKDTISSVSALTQPTFAIPAERDQPSHPRSFVVFSKASGRESGQDTAVHYFVQEAPGGEWKAAVETWVATAATGPLDTENVAKFTGLSVQLRKTALGSVGRDAAGAATLSATADADRTVCGRFADYMSFTTPDEPEEDDRFAPGPLTDGMVRELGDKAKKPKLKGLITYAFEHEETGPRLPVLKLDNGTSLVACPLRRTEKMRGTDSTVTFSFADGSDYGALLDAKGKKWRSWDAQLSLTALIELPPAGTPGPAQVASCNCVKPLVLEVTGKRAD